MSENDGSNPAPFLEREPGERIDDLHIIGGVWEKDPMYVAKRNRIALAIGKLFAAHRTTPTFGEIADVAISEYERTP